MKIRYRKWRKTRVLPYDPRNWDAEPGDLMVGHGRLVRLMESNGRDKAALGELTEVDIKPPVEGAMAILEDGEVYWVDEATYWSK